MKDIMIKKLLMIMGMMVVGISAQGSAMAEMPTMAAAATTAVATVLTKSPRFAAAFTVSMIARYNLLGLAMYTLSAEEQINALNAQEITNALHEAEFNFWPHWGALVSDAQMFFKGS